MIVYRECWCGARWFSPRSTTSGYDPMALWCPSAPVAPDVLPPKGTLMVSVTSDRADGWIVRVHNRGLSTALTTFDNPQLALLVAHTFYRAYSGSAGWAAALVQELRSIHRT